MNKKSADQTVGMRRMCPIFTCSEVFAFVRSHDQMSLYNYKVSLEALLLV